MIGQLVRLARWQKREIERIYDNPAGTRLAILSFGRCKNGKNRARRFFAAGQSMRPDRLSPAEFAAVISCNLTRTGKGTPSSRAAQPLFTGRVTPHDARACVRIGPETQM
jgi:hypothetical protein